VIVRRKRDRLAGNDDVTGICAWAYKDDVAISGGIDRVLDCCIVLRHADRAGRPT